MSAGGGGNDPQALNAQGTQRKAAGDLPGAIESYRRAIAAAPDYAGAWFNLGLALALSGRPREAADAMRRVVELSPSDGEAWSHLGVLLREAGLPSEAVEALQRAAALLPASPENHAALGLALLDAGRGAEAAARFEQALRLGEQHAELYNNLGAAQRLAGRPAQARAALERAIALNPALAEAHLNLGDLLAEQRDWEAAARRYAEGLQTQPGHASLAERLLTARQHVCDWSGYEELCERRLSALRAAPELISPPFSLLSIPSSAAEQRQCAERFARRLAARARQAGAPAWAYDAAPRARIRLGYLSADFHDHVTAYVLAEVLELHDRGAFELLAYSVGPDDGSALRARIAAAVDRFVDLRAMSDREAAARIHADGVDILLDLNGYTENARSGIAAYRPAPVQVNYLGYPGTLGAAYIDYVIADRFVLTPEVAREFAEQPVYMPGCYAPNDRRRKAAATPPRRALGLPEKGFVFCCFNQGFKIGPQAFAAWMRILRAVPSSVLWLLEAGAAATRNLRAAAAAHGVDGARLVISPRVPPAEYLARLGAADLFLDTWPYNAHTTAADALWAGLPVLTFSGRTFTSRVAGSMVTAAGLPELATASAAQFEDTAIRLARSREELAGLRARLAASKATAPLFDTAGYTRALEDAYREMDALRRSGMPARALAPQSVRSGRPG